MDPQVEFKKIINYQKEGVDLCLGKNKKIFYSEF